MFKNNYPNNITLTDDLTQSTYGIVHMQIHITQLPITQVHIRKYL